MAESDNQLSDDEIARHNKHSLQRAFSRPPEPHGNNPTTPRAPKAKTRPEATRHKSASRRSRTPRDGPSRNLYGTYFAASTNVI
jgi:hypothetical protein